MNNVDPATFTTPEVNGTFNGWCGSCAAMTDADGDNVWEVTIDLANGPYEFKYSADGWGIQEDLLPVQDENIPFVREEDLLAQEGDLPPVQEDDLRFL